MGWLTDSLPRNNHDRKRHQYSLQKHCGIWAESRQLTQGQLLHPCASLPARCHRTSSTCRLNCRPLQVLPVAQPLLQSPILSPPMQARTFAPGFTPVEHRLLTFRRCLSHSTLSLVSTAVQCPSLPCPTHPAASRLVIGPQKHTRPRGCASNSVHCSLCSPSISNQACHLHPNSN